MDSLRFTLVSDGSSDRALLPLLRWLLHEAGVRVGIDPYWADLRILPNPPADLAGRIAAALGLHPCDLLFVHRDAESQLPAARRAEIARAIEAAGTPHRSSVPVIPVRMTEAWFLFDEGAIRSASGNPRGTTRLDLPRLREVESLSDPKSLLHGLLRTASELRTRSAKPSVPAAGPRDGMLA